MLYLCSICLVVFLWLDMPREEVSVIFCDVGQGDAILVQHGFMQLLIDTGKDTKVLSCLEEHMPKIDRHINFLLLTHMDNDHIGGATAVLERFSVGTLFMNPSTKKTDDFGALQQVISRKVAQKMQLFSLFSRDRVQLSSLLGFLVLSPRVGWYESTPFLPLISETTLSDVEAFFAQNLSVNESENDLSIALILDIGSICFVLTGDMESNSELAVVSSGMTRDCDVLKAGHHGSKSSSIPQFVEHFQPEIIVVSAGKNNSYNHPSPQVMEYFSQQNMQVFQTATSGSIHFVSNGTAYWLQ